MMHGVFNSTDSGCIIFPVNGLNASVRVKTGQFGEKEG
jgi:hypothetical protein